jgi:serine/threonine protein kinase
MDKHDFSTFKQAAEETSVDSTTRYEPDPLIGSLLDRRYLVQRKLGHGGFGVVYLASDEKMMSRPVVVKALLDERISSEWSVRKFKQEMEALARVDHPSIVGIFDSGQLDNGKPFLVMQYVDGASLRVLIKPEGMDLSRAANIIRQTGRALSAAHDRGILHRDLKPENIMVQTLGDGEEQVKVIDFGVAKIKNSVLSSSTVGEQTVGTVLYMSPEQLKAEPMTAASDVYCFAVMTYEMLTGRRPNNPDSAFQLLEMQRAGVRIKPRDLRPNLSPAAEAILLKALSFNPKERYEKAREFGDALSTALLGEIDDPSELTRVEGPKSPVESTLETAHVLFTDIVGYTKLLIDQQTDCLRKLQAIVSATEEFRRPRKQTDLIRVPTGDGMALAFFDDPEAPVRCAMQISQAMRQSSCGFNLRMGIHSGLVYHIADINMNLNIAGGGINLAQRVMECGDGGHIIVSKRVADDLAQLARWSDYLHDLGEVEVKHDLRVHVFNFYGDDFGNAATPSRVPELATPLPIYKRKAAIAAMTLVLMLLVGGVVWMVLNPNAKPQPPARESAPPIGPEQSLTYWLTVQKMRNQKPEGEPIESAGDNIFGNGWRFRFNLRPAQSGALYLFNLGPGEKGVEEYNILFPIPQDDQPLPLGKVLDATLAAGQTVQLPRTKWYRFVDKTGAEKIWIIWSAAPVAALNKIFEEAARNKDAPGVITNPEHIAQIQTLQKKYYEAPPESQTDKATKLTLVKGRGEVLVNLIQLSHEAY